MHRCGKGTAEIIRVTVSVAWGVRLKMENIAFESVDAVSILNAWGESANGALFFFFFF